ncbi:hypothetical protein [Paenibacillus mendelii]|uniref:MalT-like TPR region domain-containing protein n=1 Tax=Paenibacillus mendelii TaxID=206163 RepID=A0ABV6JKF3_9BACL|nr:hypothetical protein [Paenibacillus mendelii]MCQ6559098.1 hypothetical protein [Paenibacillus mendelii]
MSKAQNVLNKALKYLDLGRSEQGELCLKQAIEIAEAERDCTTYIRAAICYGDLLWEMERAAEAERWLTLALDRYASTQTDTDVLDMEMNRAKALLDEMAKE